MSLEELGLKKKKAKPKTVDKPSAPVSAPMFSAADWPKLTNKMLRFLNAYAECGIIKEAAKLAGMNKRTHHRDLKSNPAYREAFDLARDSAIEGLELEARRRAMKSSDLLLIFLLKALKPDMYRENKFETKITTETKVLSDDEIAIRFRALASRIRDRENDSGGKGRVPQITEATPEPVQIPALSWSADESVSESGR